MTRDQLERLAERLLAAADEIVGVLDALREADAEDDGTAEPAEAATVRDGSQLLWAGNA